jgi:peptide/nickel transport system substrate-binding protein
LPYDGGVARPFVCTALLCLAAAACKPPAGGPAAALAPGAASDIVAVAYSDPRSREDGERALEILVGFFADERLVALGRDGRPEPRLAERWEMSPDGLTWRFTLRQGLVFQNGQPITSTDARAAIVPDPQAPDSAVTPGLRDLVAVETPTPREMIIRLKRPNAFLLEGLNLSPVTGEGDSGAGPFRLDTRTPGKVTLRRFDRYYRGRSDLAGVSIAEYPSQREAWSAMMRGDVDVLYDIAPDAFEFVKESPNAHIASHLRPYVIALTFNMAHPRLGRRDVRRALNQAIDRTRLIDAVVGGRGVPAVDHIWPNHWARDAAAPAFVFDPAAARTALDAAGLRRKAGSRTPSRFSFTCLVQADPRYERLALLIQRQLLTVDVDMRLEAVPLSAFRPRVASGKFDAFLGELIASHGLSFTYMWWRSTPEPFIRTGYAGADAALERVRAARTDDDLRQAVRDLQRTMHDDPPAAFLYWGQASRAVSRRFVLPAAGDDVDIMRTVDRWRLVDRPAAGAGAP